MFPWQAMAAHPEVGEENPETQGRLHGLGKPVGVPGHLGERELGYRLTDYDWGKKVSACLRTRERIVLTE